MKNKENDKEEADDEVAPTWPKKHYKLDTIVPINSEFVAKQTSYYHIAKYIIYVPEIVKQYKVKMANHERIQKIATKLGLFPPKICQDAAKIGCAYAHIVKTFNGKVQQKNKVLLESFRGKPKKPSLRVFLKDNSNKLKKVSKLRDDDTVNLGNIKERSNWKCNLFSTEITIRYQDFFSSPQDLKDWVEYDGVSFKK